jgi:hypothetical protein
MIALLVKSYDGTFVLTFIDEAKLSSVPDVT